MPETREALRAGTLVLRRREKLKRGVYRLRVDADGRPLRLVVKRVDSAIERRCVLVAARWLPAVGLGDACAPLLATRPSLRAGKTWLVYRDLGPRTLASESDRTHVAATVGLVAEIHRRFAGHAILAECRAHADDLGASFYAASVGGAIELLERIGDPVERLLAWLHRLEAERSARMEALAEWGGPVTVLHGDLWTTNVLVVPGGPRLVDWDHCGVGHPAYDVSTFLLRFPPAERRSILAGYEAAMRGTGWRFPSEQVWNLLFDSAERARLAHCARWAALAVLDGHAAWGLGRLREIETWLHELNPVLPG
jgi:hypothetical protein